MWSMMASSNSLSGILCKISAVKTGYFDEDGWAGCFDLPQPIKVTIAITSMTIRDFILLVFASAGEFLRRNARVMPTETERVVDDRVDLQFTRGVGHVVEVALRIGVLVIDR